MDQTKKLDFRFGEFIAPDEESMTTISKGVKQMAKESDACRKKQKITHSISPLSQAMIKDFADECGVTQGTIVELAPILFRMIAARSMERRKTSFQQLVNIQTQIDTALSSMAEIAPHLKPCVDFLREATLELCRIEKTAIEAKNFKGANISESAIFKTVVQSDPEIAFHKDIMDGIQENEALKDLFDITIQS